MIHFTDGPAQGASLLVTRKVLFLRVVTRDGTWHAVSAKEDEVRFGERAVGYVMVDPPVTKGEIIKGEVEATYRHIEGVPPGALRDKASWAEWVAENSERWQPDWAKAVKAA